LIYEDRDALSSDAAIFNWKLGKSEMIDVDSHVLEGIDVVTEGVNFESLTAIGLQKCIA